MRSRYLRRSLAVAPFLVAATLGSVGAATAVAATTPYCGITWGSLPKANQVMSPAALTDVRTGRHDCFDRVVFDFQGAATGYRVQYADHVFSQGKGDELSIAGGAKLDVVLFENDYNIDTGAVTYHPQAANLSGYRTLRDLVYGGSFGGYPPSGVGVRAHLPFRVFTLPVTAGHSRIVIDVAHQWSS